MGGENGSTDIRTALIVLYGLHSVSVQHVERFCYFGWCRLRVEGVWNPESPRQLLPGHEIAEDVFLTNVEMCTIQSVS